jgi:acetyl-CoA synthase
MISCNSGVNQMSNSFASLAISGAHKIIKQSEETWKRAVDNFGIGEPVGFPNTDYFLPVIYGILGSKVEKLGDMEHVFKKCYNLLQQPFTEKNSLHYTAQALNAGMAVLFAQEIIESIRYLEYADFYTKSELTNEASIWLGAADDVILRKRGIEFIDGTAPGLAIILGAATTNETAVNIINELQQKNIYVFMSGRHNDKRFTEQLLETNIPIGWPTRLIPLGPDVSSTVFALGFATRAALSFGEIQAGDFKNILLYSKNRILAFLLAAGTFTEEWAATAAGALNFGIPVIADTPITEIIPSGAYDYENIISNIPQDYLVSKAIEVRGIKVNVSNVLVTVAYGELFVGERVREENVYLDFGGGRNNMVEWVTSMPVENVEDGKIEVIGPEIDDINKGDRLPMAICIETAGRQMQEDFEPIMERRIHHFLNYAHGIMHTGQRDIARLRISKQAVGKGFKIKDIGTILYAKFHQEFGSIFDKLQVIIYTNEDDVISVINKAREVYKIRDARIEGMTDENTDTYYSCTICQSLSPSHVCIITPERTGMCGSYNWMDCKASYNINPTGPNQPVLKGATIDAKLGQWKGVNDFIYEASRGKIDHYNLYSIVFDPMTICECCECVSAVLPICNGVMIVNRKYMGMTPCGMKFTNIAETIERESSTPGFIGHCKYNITQRKFISAEGSLLRVVWMPKMLKEEIRDKYIKRAEELGVPDLLDRVADETIGTAEEEIIDFLTEREHPALNLPPILG